LNGKMLALREKKYEGKHKETLSQNTRGSKNVFQGMGEGPLRIRGRKRQEDSHWNIKDKQGHKKQKQPSKALGKAREDLRLENRKRRGHEMEKGGEV